MRKDEQDLLWQIRRAMQEAQNLKYVKKLIEDDVVDVVISIGNNFFYTVTLPCTLWFFDKGKVNNRSKR